MNTSKYILIINLDNLIFYINIILNDNNEYIPVLLDSNINKDDLNKIKINKTTLFKINDDNDIIEIPFNSSILLSLGIDKKFINNLNFSNKEIIDNKLNIQIYNNNSNINYGISEQDDSIYNKLTGLIWLYDDVFLASNKVNPIYLAKFSLSSGIIASYILDDSGLSEITDLSYDNENDKLYILDSNTGYIFVYTLDTMQLLKKYILPFNSLSDEKLSGIEIDNIHKCLYISSKNENKLYKFPIQTLTILCGNITYKIPAKYVPDLEYNEDNTQFTVMGKTFILSEINNMYFEDAATIEDKITITYTDNSASIIVSGISVLYITASVTSANVTITLSADLSTELSYLVTGTSDNGQFKLSGSYKTSIELSNLELTNSNSAPIDIEIGKRIALTLSGNSILNDSSVSTLKGCLYIKGHTEFYGNGTLTINAYGSKAHGIYSGEYIEFSDIFTGNIIIGNTTKDGIHCLLYMLMNSGNLTITNPGDDGILIEACEDTAYDEDIPDGNCVINGGTINISIQTSDVKGLRCDNTLIVTNKCSTPNITIIGSETAYAAKGIKADIIDIQAGIFDIELAGKGIWDAEDLETSACAALKSVYTTISGGTFNFIATGSGGKGINCDNSLTYTGGNMTITTTGGCYVYLNNTEYTDYTSSLDNIDTAYKSSSKGIKVGNITTDGTTETKNGEILISGGTIKITTSTNGAEGIECKGTINIAGGSLNITSYDDAINSGKALTISDGDITVNGLNNDGLDSNGDLWITGGIVCAYGTTAPECGIDANEEENYHAYFTGGRLLAIGGGNSVPNNSNSTLAYVSTNGVVTSGTQIILSSGSTTLSTFDITRSYSNSNNGSNLPSGNQPGSNQGGGGSLPSGNQPGNASSVAILMSCAELIAGLTYTITSGTYTYSVIAKKF